MSEASFRAALDRVIAEQTNAVIAPSMSARNDANMRAIVEVAAALSELAADVYPPTIDIGGEPVPVRRGGDLAKIEAFDRIAAFVGMAGRVGGAAKPHELLHEVGNIVGTVRGVPAPNADDTERHYRKIAPDRLTRKQLRMVGLGEGS